MTSVDDTDKILKKNGFGDGVSSVESVSELLSKECKQKSFVNLVTFIAAVSSLERERMTVDYVFGTNVNDDSFR
jgi:hypothetical protein